MSEVNVVNNEAGMRFEVQQEGLVAVLEYEREGAVLKLVHTNVPEALGGRGLGGALAKAGLEYARAQGRRLRRCARLCRTIFVNTLNWDNHGDTEARRRKKLLADKRQSRLLANKNLFSSSLCLRG